MQSSKLLLVSECRIRIEWICHKSCTPVYPLGRHAAQDRQPASDVVAIRIKHLGLVAVHQHVVKGVRICARPTESRQVSSRSGAVSTNFALLQLLQGSSTKLTAGCVQGTHDMPAMLCPQFIYCILSMTSAQYCGTMCHMQYDGESLDMRPSCLLRSTRPKRRWKMPLTCQAAGHKLPAEGGALQIGVQQGVPVVLEAPLPGQQQVLDQEAGADDADAVVQPAAAPQLAHARVHQRVPSPPLPPRLHTRPCASACIL